MRPNAWRSRCAAILLGAWWALGASPAAFAQPEDTPTATQPSDAPHPSETPAPADDAQQDNEASARGPRDPIELEAFVDGILAAQMHDKHIAGATIAFVVDGKPFFSKGYGYADVAARKAVDPAKTMFRIGSVSKLFTWTAVMQLAEQGKLDLQADINQYLSDFQIPATYPEPITLANLMSHTPGFEDHVIGLFAHSPENISPLGELLARELPARVRKPGELSSYSNHGTAIAGYIVQHVSGMPWADYIEQKILEPLGMHHTTVRQAARDTLPDAMCKGYKYAAGRYVEQGFEYVPAAPAGSMSASAEDMTRFMIAHLQGGASGDVRILQQDTTGQMHSLLFTHDPRIEGMAYGFMRMKYGDERIIEHGGDTFAFHSHCVMLPERRSGYFVSYNTTTAGSARNTLLRAVLDRYYPPAEPAPRQPANDFGDRAARYAGQYGAIRHSYTSLAKLGALFSVAEVSVDNDALVLAFGGDNSHVRFVEIEPGLFQELDGQRMVAFRENGDGPATHWFVGGSPVAWARLPWYETPRFSLGIIVACVAIFTSAVVGWPLAAFINRGSGEAVKRTAGSKLASWLAWAASLASLVVIGLAMIPFNDSQEIAYGVPPLLRGLLLATPVIALLVAGALLCTILAWARSYWRLSARLHYTCVLAAGLAFVWFLLHWNLLGVPLAT